MHTQRAWQPGPEATQAHPIGVFPFFDRFKGKSNKNNTKLCGGLNLALLSSTVSSFLEADMKIDAPQCVMFSLKYHQFKKKKNNFL